MVFGHQRVDGLHLSFGVQTYEKSGLQDKPVIWDRPWPWESYIKYFCEFPMTSNCRKGGEISGLGEAKEGSGEIKMNYSDHCGNTVLGKGDSKFWTLAMYR